MMKEDKPKLKFNLFQNVLNKYNDEIEKMDKKILEKTLIKIIKQILKENKNDMSAD